MGLLFVYCYDQQESILSNCWKGMEPHSAQMFLKQIEGNSLKWEKENLKTCICVKTSSHGHWNLGFLLHLIGFFYLTLPNCTLPLRNNPPSYKTHGGHVTSAMPAWIVSFNSKLLTSSLIHSWNIYIGTSLLAYWFWVLISQCFDPVIPPIHCSKVYNLQHTSTKPAWSRTPLKVADWTREEQYTNKLSLSSLTLSAFSLSTHKQVLTGSLFQSVSWCTGNYGRLIKHNNIAATKFTPIIIYIYIV